MPVYTGQNDPILRGLKASDRTKEEQAVINQQMGYKNQPEQEEIKINSSSSPSTPAPTHLPAGAKLDTDLLKRGGQEKSLAQKIKDMAPEYSHMTELYKEDLAESGAKFGYGRNTVSANASDYLDKVSNEVSSYYKKYKGTSKLNDNDLTPEKVKSLAMDYQAREKAYGKDAAAYWLDKQYKEMVANNQSWMEQAWNGFSHLVPSIEGGAVELVGNIWGIINPIVSLIDNDLELPETEGLGWWHNYINNILDNPVTRLGHDIERAGASYAVQSLYNMIDSNSETADERIASMKNSATKYNKEGIGSDVIVLREDQENSVLNSATPWEALQSSGFTTLSMLTGAGLAGVSNKIFGGVIKGVNYLNKTGKALKTAESLEKALINIKKAQNATNMFVVPGLTGSVEGMQEGLNTKIQVEQEGMQKLDDFYKDKIEKEVAAIYAEESKKPQTMTEVRDADGNKRMVKTGGKSYAQIYKEVLDKYQNEYLDARKQIEFAASEAGVHNFYANSLINGMLNMTLKAGLQSDRVQETLRNSKLFGWAYKKPNFTINTDGTVKPKFTKLGAIAQYIKEPIGEGIEELSQSLSNDTFAGAAGNNIDEFIKRKFSGDSNVQVGDMFASDYGAAWSSFLNSWTKADTWKSAVLGAVGSVMGSASMPHKGYRRDENGNLVKGGYWGRQLREDGTQETAFEAAARMAPWRSGLVNAYFDRRREIQQANKTAERIQEWLQDPQHRAKWDGLVGTASWMNEMHNAAESNDQFNFRNAQMGKAINDAIMLSQLQGTDLYETIMADLKRSSEMNVTSQEGQAIVEQMRNSGNEEFQNKTDEEVIDKIKSNANKMLGIMSQVEENGSYFDRLLGRVDENTKQSLIFGKMMEKNFQERRDALEQEINRIKGEIKNSRSASRVNLEEDLKSLIIKYGSLKQAMHAEESLRSKKEKAEKRKEELETLGKDKLTDKQKEELEAKSNEVKAITQQLTTFTGLHEKDEKGRDTGKGRSDLATLMLNEQEIMDLDNATRAVMLATGATRYYNATHQNRQKVDELNMQIDEIQKKIDTLEEQKKKWVDSEGNVKKGHNKQVQRNDKAIKQLEKDKYAKMRELDTEKGEAENTKNVYSEAQQAVIDNLMQQAQAVDENFLDKTVDIARLEKGVKNYHQQLQSILSDPKAFSNYVERVKFNTAQDLLRRRAERVARIEDYKEFSRELDKLMADASDMDMMTIINAMRENSHKTAKQRESERIDRIINGEEEGQLITDENGDVVVDENEEENPIEVKTNWDRYRKNQENQSQLIDQFAKNTNLTDNGMSLLVDAMQYLAQEGIDVTDRENVVETLLEKDEQGNLGGKFRQWVEERNTAIPEEQRAFMPKFTSIGQVVNDYVELLNGREIDHINKADANITIFPLAEGANGVINEETEKAREENRKKAGEEESIDEIEKAFKRVTIPEIARSMNIVKNVLETMQFTDEGENVPITEKEKELVRQSLMDVAVNSDGSFDTMDEVVDAILDKANELQRQQDMMEDESDKTYDHAATAMRNITQRLKVLNQGRRNVNTKPKRPLSPQSSTINTADIAWIEQKNPDAWAVKFTDEHGIAEYCREHTFPTDMPIYFITDSEWTAEVIRNMSDSKNSKRDYDTLTDMPIVAAVEVAEPKNPDTTTAIKVGDKWYQPIGVMPSTKSIRSGGAERTFAMRQLASKEQGTHLITADGMPNGKPLISHVAGNNYINAHHPDDTNGKRNNNGENNTDIQEDILAILPMSSVQRLKGLSKADMLKDSEYIAARTKFINRLSWGTGYSGTLDVLNNQMLYTPDDLKHNIGSASDTSAQPIVVSVKPMSETTARESDKSLTDVLENGTADEAVTFNSITQRLYSKVIRPLFEYIPMTESKDISAGVITQTDINENPDALQAEADRLTVEFNGYDGTAATKGKRGISDYIYISKTTGYSIKVMADTESSVIGDMDNSKSVYSVLLMKEDGSASPVFLGQIVAAPKTGAPSQENIEAAKQMLKNLLKECTSGVLAGSAKWQNAENNVLNLHTNDMAKSSKAREIIADMVDDGVFELWGSSLVYNIDGLELRAPIATDGRIVYPYDRVVNPSNAQPSAPINNTPQAQGTVETKTGAVVEAGSGAILNNPPAKPIPKGKSEAEKKAEAITNKIVADTADFTLSEDESYYYVTDKETGQRVKYLRVTTVISADESITQWFPTAQELKDKLGLTKLANNAAVAINTAAGKEETGDGALQKSLISDAIDVLSETSGKSKQEIQKAIVELRTEHKKTKYGPWGVPSTTLGNTADIITRDFFAGELRDHYPNITDAVLSNFKASLNNFMNDLTSKGIKIVSRDVMAHGKITVTDENGSSHEVNVAGTLDLLGYDNKGNFYIFDMKTSRNIIYDKNAKLQRNKAKWSRQISLYADLLKQSYPGFDVKPGNLRIIPINVNYPAPQGRGRGLNPFGGTYSVVPKGQPNEGQLQVTDRSGNTTDYIIDHPDNFTMLSSDLQGQFQPGYTHFNISWNNLSSEDQEIVGILQEQAPIEPQGKQPATPSTAEVTTPQRWRSSLDADIFNEEWENNSTMEAPVTVAPIVPAENFSQSLASWADLSDTARQFLQEGGWATDESEYNDILDDPSTMEALKNELKCRGLI